MNKKMIIISSGVLIAALFIAFKLNAKAPEQGVETEVNPKIGSIQTYISSTGTVLPKNRLEVRPPVAGRIETILVKEGQTVKKGEAVATMSSTERAALLDAAQAQGEEKVNYWKEAYKPIALLAPIDAEVIVATTQPGQTVTTTDAVIVLSDKLIARAQVDETDIRKIKEGQKAQIILDAYPDTKIEALVEHIYYESKTVNNVTIYEVDLAAQKLPDFFRSGMNCTVNFITNDLEGVLTVPVEAVYLDKDEAFVLKKGGKEGIRQPVKLGITDDKSYEVISGISASDTLLVRNKKFVLPKSDMGSSPFTPFSQRRSSTGAGKKQ